MANKIKSIFEPFSDYVQNQLRVRKAIMSNPRSVVREDENEPWKISSDANNDSRSTPDVESDSVNSIYGPEHFFTYTTEKQAIIRMMSGVDLQDEVDPSLLEIQTDENGKQRKYDKATRRNDEMYLNHSMGLAKQYILEGGTRYYDDKGDNRGTREGFTSGVFADDTKRGFSYGDRDIRADAADGFGVVPMPGIIDAKIRTKSDNGSLREAQVNFMCHNRRQLEVLELLYMRPGYPVCLEWGWNPYISNDFTRENNDYSIKNYFFKDGADMNELNDKIRQHKKNSGGNYDGFIGFIKNFSFKAREDGGYDCTTEIMAHGEILESLKSTKMSVNTGADLPDKEHAEVESIDRFLYYLRSIKATLNNQGDQWYYKNRGTYYDSYDKVPEVYNTNYQIITGFHCPARVEGCDLISEAPTDAGEFGYSEVHCIYGYDGLCADKNYKIPLQYGKPLYANVNFDLEPDEGYIEDPNDFEGTTEEHMESLNRENVHYAKGYDDILALYSKINKVNEIKITDSSNQVGEGYIPLVGGTILKQVVKYDQEVGTSSDDTPNVILDTGYRKNIYVRWDMVCQMINHLSTHSDTSNFDSQLHSPITELTYMHSNEPSFINSPVGDGKKDQTLDQIEQSNGGFSYIKYEPPILKSTDPSLSTYLSPESNTNDDKLLELGQLRLEGSIINEGSPGTNLHPLIGSSFNERICLLPHMPMFAKYYGMLGTVKDGEDNELNIEVDSNFADGVDKKRSYNVDFSFLQSHTSTENPSSQIGLIYFNLDFLLETYESMRLKKSISENLTLVLLNDNFNMLDYIKALWDGVNASTADYYKFTVTTEHERPHVARIVDMRFQRNTDDGIFIFEPQGLKSVTRQFFFNSKISNDMASLISIAAQAPNNSQSLESLSFKAFHKNIRSRFSSKDFRDSERTENEKQAAEQLKNDIKKYQQLCTSLSYYLHKLNQGNFEDEGDAVSVPLISNSEAVMNAQSIMDLRHSILMRYPLEDEDGNPNDGSSYDSNGDGEKDATKAKAGFWRKGTSMDNSAIIPLQFNLQMDGIAGMILLQIFKVDKDKLPFGYQRKDIVFIVKSESHTITSGQDWTVEITGQMALLNLNPNDRGRQGGEGEYIDIPNLDPIIPALEVSTQGSTLIGNFEGFKITPYHDGYNTDGTKKYAVGYGTQTWNDQKVTVNYPASSEVTQESARKEMVKHMEKSVYPYIKNHVTVNLNQAQFDAVASYVYNVGAGNSVAGDTQFIKKLNAGNYEGASKEIDIISQNQGDGTYKVVKGLMTRRAKEQRLFNGHAYGYDNTDGDFEECQENGCPPGRNNSQNLAYTFTNGFSDTAFPNIKYY